jgi:hypothetical protein
MDHHCPWVNNCVGSNNYKSFILFVAYTALLSVFGGLTMIPAITELDWSNVTGSQIVMLVTVGIAGIFGLMLSTFSFAHCGMILRGVTTLEEHFPEDQPQVPLPGDRRAHFEAVFGPNPWLWFIPLQNQPRDYWEADSICSV